MPEYQGLTFSALETPTLAKWNQLWENDAFFYDPNRLYVDEQLDTDITGISTTWTPVFNKNIITTVDNEVLDISVTVACLKKTASGWCAIKLQIDDTDTLVDLSYCPSENWVHLHLNHKHIQTLQGTVNVKVLARPQNNSMTVDAIHDVNGLIQATQLQVMSMGGESS